MRLIFGAHLVFHAVRMKALFFHRKFYFLAQGAPFFRFTGYGCSGVATYGDRRAPLAGGCAAPLAPLSVRLRRGRDVSVFLGRRFILTS